MIGVRSLPPDLSWMPDPAAVRRWAQEAGERAGGGPEVPERTGVLPVADAVAALSVGANAHDLPMPEWDRAAAAALARAQVCLADVATFIEVALIGPARLGRLLYVLSERLAMVARPCPRMPVRDAVGWMLLLSSPVGRQPALGTAVLDHWAAVDLAEPGWLYAGAGFTPEEARAGLDAGSLTEEAARALAALRGVPLPA